MRIHDRYVLGLYLKILLFCVLGFTIVFLLIDVFERLGDFIDNHARTVDVMRYFLYKIPEMVRLTLPVDVLLATMLTLGILGRNNEIVALLAGGVSLVRVTRPLILIAVVWVGVSALLSEVIVPRTNDRMHTIKRVDIEKKPPRNQPLRHHFSYYGKTGYLWFARSFNTRTATLRDVVVSFYAGGQLVQRVDAERAVWDRGMWRFENGFLRRFGPEGERAEPFRQLNMPELQETPEELARIEPEPEAMTFRQLRRYVERIRASGVDIDEYVVDLHIKISYPFTVMIMTLLGIGLSASKRKRSLATGFTWTLVIAFTYLVLLGVGEALGKNHALPPALAAWSPPGIFALLSAGLLTRIDR